LPSAPRARSTTCSSRRASCATSSPLLIRAAEPADAEAAGRICYEAFREIAERHGFPPDFPSAEPAIGLVSHLIGHPGFYGVAAELDGRVVGSNFMDERSTIFGIGPITVDLAFQNERVGRRLMLDVLDHARERGAAGIRLLQSAYHNRSLALYSGLGFDVRETLLIMQGDPIGERSSGFDVRAGSEEDLASCNELCLRVHGHDRGGEVLDAARAGSLRIVEHAGRLVGYTTAVGFLGHSVAETNDGLKALVADAQEFGGPGLLVPARNAELVRWCLGRRLRIVHTMTLMTIGLYNEPGGAWLPSVLF
jgi:predicted N-acetyltransferase YhbS